MALVQETVGERIPNHEVGILFRAGAFLLLLSALLSGLPNTGELLFVATVGICLLALLVRKRVDVLVLWPTLFLAALMASALVVDSFPNTQSLEAFVKRLPEFVVGEGRVLLSFIPLLLAAVCRPGDRSIGGMVRLYRGIAWVGLLMITIGWLPPIRQALFTEIEGQLHGLSSSHHVSGFLFGITALIMLTTHRGNRRTNLWLGLALLVAVVLTGSRTSLLGLFFAALAALLLRSSTHLSARWLRRFRVATVVAIVLILPLQSTLRVPIFDSEVLSSGVENLSNPDPKLETGYYDYRTANTLKRFVLWGQGVDDFWTSPVIGIGAFRFNDEVSRTWGVEGVAQLSMEGRRDHSVTTAHNSYLHVAAEMGLVGLALMLAVWLSLAYRLQRQRRDRLLSEEVRSDAESAMLVIAFALGTGLTSASLFTPGLCIPALLYAGTMAMRGDLVRRPPVAVTT